MSKAVPTSSFGNKPKRVTPRPTKSSASVRGVPDKGGSKGVRAMPTAKQGANLSSPKRRSKRK